jgi:curli biogenesis system outer membrane secretion channel CsgG
MYKQLLFGLALAAFCFSGLQAQDDKTKIAMLKFTYDKNNGNAEHYATTLQDKVVEGFVKSKRFEMIERNQLDQLMGEMKMQEVASDSQVAKLGNTLGVQYVILGNVSNVSAGDIKGSQSWDWNRRSSWTYTGSDVGFTAQVAVALRVVEVATGKIKVVETLQSKIGGAGQVGAAMGSLGNFGRLAQAGAKAGMAKSPEEAVSKAIEKLDEEVMKFIDRNFPMYVDILEAKPNKKGDGIGEMEIAVGSEMGFEKGDVLKVVKVNQREIKGRKTFSLDFLGLVKILQVTGELTSKCEIIKGGPEIKAAYDADKDKVRVLFDGNKKL